MLRTDCPPPRPDVSGLGPQNRNHHRLARSDSGWVGVPTAVVAGAATPGGSVIGFSIGAVALNSSGGAPQVMAYVIAWALFAFQRMILWGNPVHAGAVRLAQSGGLAAVPVFGAAPHLH